MCWTSTTRTLAHIQLGFGLQGKKKLFVYLSYSHSPSCFRLFHFIGHIGMGIYLCMCAHEIWYPDAEDGQVTLEPQPKVWKQVWKVQQHRRLDWIVQHTFAKRTTPPRMPLRRVQQKHKSNAHRAKFHKPCD